MTAVKTELRIHIALALQQLDKAQRARMDSKDWKEREAAEQAFADELVESIGRAFIVERRSRSSAVGHEINNGTVPRK